MSKVVDGDTVWVDRSDRTIKVRLIGIDTPETKDPRRPVECFGPEAAARTTELLSGQRVYLDHDSTQDTVDRYGRELVYLWLPEGRTVQEILLTGGYAREYTYDRAYRLQTTYRRAQATAKKVRRGLWSECS